VTFDNMAKAIEVFEATLITPGSRFDKFLAGDAQALNAQGKQGLKTFMDKGCVACHNGINVGGQAYFPFGLVEKPRSDILPANDKGRFAVTRSPNDEYVFRAAPLRNVALRAPYFHTGQVWNLTEAVDIMSTDQLGQKLTDADKAVIVAFLGTLTGVQPQVQLPVLPVRTNATSKPAS